MATDQERLVLSIEARMAQFEKAMAKATGTADRSARRIEQRFSKTETFLRGFGSGALKGFVAQAAAILSAGAVFRSFIQNTIEAQNVTAQLEARLKSTGGVVGLTVDELQEMASSLQGVTTFGDEAIAGAEALLLTFTKIGGDVFPQATETVLDMSTALGQDLKSSAVQVGKALQDPILGITALRRVGVNFSDAQKTVIKNMVETGRLAEAQALILKELQVEFGGSAVAARDTLGGALKALQEAWGDLFEMQGPAADALKDSIEDLITAITDPAFARAVQLIGTNLVQALEAAARAAPQLADAFVSLRQRAADFKADIQDTIQTVQDYAAAVGRGIGTHDIGEAIGFTDEATLRINRASEAVKRAAPQFELLEALQRKAAARTGDLIAAPAREGAVFVDPEQVDQETDALEAEAAAIDAAAEAAKEAEAARKRAAAEVKRQKEAVVDLIDQLEFENSLIGLSNEQRETEIALRRAGAVATDEQRAKIADLVATGIAEQQALDETIARMDELRYTAADALSAFNDSLRDGEGLAGALRSALDRVLDTIIRIAEQQAITALFGAPGTTGGGSLGGILGSLFGGARASGGPVMPGKAYVVGEKRPELFIPSVAGRIAPSIEGTMGGQVSVRVEPSPLFITSVQSQIGGAIRQSERSTAARLANEQARYG